MSRERGGLGRKPDCEDDLAGPQIGLPLWLLARQTVQAFDRHLPRSLGPFELDHGAQGRKGHAEVGRMRGDAMLAPPQDGVQPVIAPPRVASGAGLAPIAGAGRIVEVPSLIHISEPTSPLYIS